MANFSFKGKHHRNNRKPTSLSEKTTKEKPNTTTISHLKKTTTIEQRWSQKQESNKQNLNQQPIKSKPQRLNTIYLLLLPFWKNHWLSVAPYVKALLDLNNTKHNSCIKSINLSFSINEATNDTTHNTWFNNKNFQNTSAKLSVNQQTTFRNLQILGQRHIISIGRVSVVNDVSNDVCLLKQFIT